MNIKKIGGMVLSILGVFSLLASFNNSREVLFSRIGLGFLVDANNFIFIIVGFIFLAAGIFLLKLTANEKEKYSEVPIYEGQGKKRRVVGYQRH